MPPRTHTTIIQGILERGVTAPAMTGEDVAVAVAVMLRVLPPPRALLAFGDRTLRQRIGNCVAPETLEAEICALAQLTSRCRREGAPPIVLTDSLVAIRTLRARQGARWPVIVYVCRAGEADGPAAGRKAGADECVNCSASAAEITSRLALVRRVVDLESVLRIALEENRRIAATDELTRVASRRFFGKHLPREFERAARYGRALSLVLCDIDHFKTINENYGHPGGDEILRQFGPRLQKVLRHGIDWAARIGGEEFAIVIPETGPEAALAVARKLRHTVSRQPFHVDGHAVAVTASFGVCGLRHVADGGSRLARAVLLAADRALYRSKHEGRNRVTITSLGGEAPVDGARHDRHASAFGG